MVCSIEIVIIIIIGGSGGGGARSDGGNDGDDAVPTTSAMSIPPVREDSKDSLSSTGIPLRPRRC